MMNALRGDYAATLAAVPYTFDTTLGTIAQIELACGDRSITEVIGGVVNGRRAADQIALLAAALGAAGVADAQSVAKHASVPEAEAFVLALMAALGFRLTPRSADEGVDQGPLDGSNAGDAGASSRSAA